MARCIPALVQAFIEELRQFGMFGLVIPEEHGWRDFPARIRVNLPPLAMVVWAREV